MSELRCPKCGGLLEAEWMLTKHDTWDEVWTCEDCLTTFDKYLEEY